MSHHSTDYAALIHKRGFRVTLQRELILEAIGDGEGHTTPEEIYQRVNAKATALNRATVYRNLDFLCEIRLVVAAKIGGQMYYEIADEKPHHHLICRKCDKIEQVGHETVKSLFDKIEREQHFKIDMDHLALFGLCQKCQRLEARSKR